MWKVGFIGQPSSVSGDIAFLFSSGLTSLSPKGEALPGLAEKWERSGRGDEYIFFLRPDIFWTDGKKVVSSDLLFSLPHVSVSYPSPEKIRFRLSGPLASFPTLLSRPIFRKNSLVGTGPCRIDKVVKKEKIERILAFCPPWDLNLDLRFYSDEEDGLLALNLGEIKILFGLENPKNLAGFRVLRGERYERFVGVFYNLSDSFLSQREIRQGLSYAIPREEFWQMAWGPISPKSWAFNPYLKGYNYNFSKAERLLEGKERPPVLSLKTTPFYYSLALKIKESWERLGISVEVETANLEQIFAAGFQTVLIAQKIPFDPDQYVLWHSTQKTNIAGLKNPKIDKLLEDGRKIFDRAKRQKIYQDFQKYLVEECPVTFLYYPEEYILLSEKIDFSLFSQVFLHLRPWRDSNPQPSP